MKVEELLNNWALNAQNEKSKTEYCLHLPLNQLANIMALEEIYATRTRDQLIIDLLELSLSRLEEAFPYIKGENIIAEDEFGEPVYEDVGITPRYIDLSKKHLKELKELKEKQ